jgi:hypothetical protein
MIKYFGIVNTRGDAHVFVYSIEAYSAANIEPMCVYLLGPYRAQNRGHALKILREHWQHETEERVRRENLRKSLGMGQ